MSTKLHAKHYSKNDRLFFLLNPNEDIAGNEPVRIVDTVVESLDLKEFKKLYRERGRYPYHPKMMLKIILYVYMNNGQTKPGYNLQLSAENQIITDFALFPNPTDTLTLISLFNSFLDRYGHLSSVAVADSGYGSEENYRFMDETGIEAYVKYNRFHLEQEPRYKPNPFHHDNFHYNTAEDYYVCLMGQHMTRTGTSLSKTASGYRNANVRYRAQNCKDCPLRCLCYKAKGDRRTIEVNHRLNEYKRKARELLTSEEGLRHRGRRCIEPKAVFGQMKFNMEYRRFRHFGKD